MSAVIQPIEAPKLSPSIHDLWLNSPHAERIYARILRLVGDPNISKPEGMLIVADPDSGKSHILKHAYRSLMSNGYGLVGERLQVPAVYFDAPPRASLEMMLADMAKALHVPNATRTPGHELARRMLTYLDDAKVKAIFVDELHHLVSGPYKSQRVVLDVLKKFSNELGIPVIAAGTERAFEVVVEDDQYRNRLRPTRLPPWSPSEFVGLVLSIEEHFSLPKGCLANPEVTELLFTYSEQRIGPTVRLIKNAYDEFHLPLGLPFDMDLLKKVIHEEAEYQGKEQSNQ